MSVDLSSILPIYITEELLPTFPIISMTGKVTGDYNKNQCTNTFNK